MAETNYDLDRRRRRAGRLCRAIRAAQLGLKTAVVEREQLGGICLNWGCIPTKALLRTSEINHLLHQLDEFGFSAKDISFDIEKIVERSRKVAKQLSNGVEVPDEEEQDHRDRRQRQARRQGQARRDQGRQAGRRAHRQEHRAGDRRAGAHAAGPGARRQADLDLSRGDGARPRCRNRCWWSARAPSASSSPASIATWAPR